MTSLDEAKLAEAAAIVNVEEQLERDEQEEWEYEYSATETETYYLTLDLSFPEFKDRQPRAPHHSRGGYYKTWLDHNPSLRGTHAGEDIDDDNEPLPEPEADNDEPEIDPALSHNKEKGKGVDRGEAADDTRDDVNKNRNESEDIQILELHSKKPIISYKGRTFEGSWAEIIGTEAIFASRDNDRPLPALRHLDGSVDFLGACASRIATKETIVKPKIIREDPLAAIREEWNIRIPVGKDRSGERAEQTRFLENLMAIKKRNKEKDQVTVWAKDGEGQDFKDNRDPDYKPRRRRRLLNEDGEEVITKREKRRTSGRRGGRPRLRPGTGRGRGSAVLTPSTTRDLASPLREGNMSTPTPSRWNEIHGREGEDMEYSDEQSDTEDDEDDEDEDMSMAD